jgi:cytochrome bd-type quinol oxidase subunit 1
MGSLAVRCPYIKENDIRNRSTINVEIQARIQFAFTIAFHPFHPLLSIGLIGVGLYNSFLFWTFNGKLKPDEMSH